MCEKFDLDSAHEALALIHQLGDQQWSSSPEFNQIRWIARNALDAIEAQLPEPCDHCGSDQCPVVHFSTGVCRP